MIAGLLDDLKADEGWSSSMYYDSLGFATIGYGFLVDGRKKLGLPLAIGEAWLKLAAEERWSALVKALPWILAQPDDIQRALGNMAYQLGVDGVLGFKLMLDALQRGDRETAAENMTNSAWHVQTRKRCERLAALVRGAA